MQGLEGQADNTIASLLLGKFIQCNKYMGLKGHLSPFCACTAVWFLIRPNTFQSWYSWEKSFSIDPMSRVEIVIPILKNCLVGHDIFKWHILFLEFKTVVKIRCPWKRIFKLARDESYLQLVYLDEKIGGWRWETYIAADVDASWEKVRWTRPSHS